MTGPNALPGRLGARSSSEDARLVRAGFGQPEIAAATLARLGLTESQEVLDALADSTDPDLALAALDRVCAAAPDRDDLLDALAAQEGFRGRLLSVLGASDALGDHLVGQPDHWHLLVDDELMMQRPSTYGLQRALLDAVGADPALPLPWGSGGAHATVTGPAAVRALRSAYRGCLLRLAARDLSGTVPVDDVAAELADLAGALLTAALAVAAAGLPATAEPCRLAVVGMGKCGGRELNYVSDVDVVYVAEPLDGGDHDRAVRTATQLASGLMQVCAQVAWQVDAGLRPEGSSGPLVRTLASHQAYYARWASTWEFQALLKARPVAGDLDLGAHYVTALAPLVWTASTRPDFVADVQAMRRRVEDSIASDRADREVKLGRGGLRDIEFAVQLLQLVHGRGAESVRSTSTLTALAELADAGYVGREDARQLDQAYRWLRTVEHRLQLFRLRRTHLLPADDDDAGIRRIARACGYRQDAVALFTRERNGYRRLVRRLHEKLFYRPLLSAVALIPDEGGQLGPAAAGQRLAALGFAEPQAALRHLEALTEGVSRRAAIQQTLLPAMLGWFAGAADPDAGLLSYRRVSDALGATPWYLRLLRDEGAVAERLSGLLATSRYVADQLVRAPEGVRLLADDAELRPRTREELTSAFVSVVRRREDWEDAVVTARGLRRTELLRTAFADLLRLSDLTTTGRALSDITASVVQAALVTATREVEAERGDPVPVRLAVIAMGRLGGLEQSYGSDVDVLFVHEPLPGASESEAAGAALQVANETRRLLALPAPDPPLEVDAGLRPEGKEGPLTRSLASYARYYETRAQVWEAQALLRAAPLAGDLDLAAEFLAMVDHVRYPAHLPEEQVAEVRRIKRRVETERLPRGVDPGLALKLGRGGLGDVEWTVQLLQLRHAHEVVELRTPSTLAALAGAVAAGVLEKADEVVLEHAWSLAARTRDALVLVRGKPALALPTGGRELDAVARCLGYGPGAQEAFLSDYRTATRACREVVERVFYGEAS